MLRVNANAHQIMKPKFLSLLTVGLSLLTVPVLTSSAQTPPAGSAGVSPAAPAPGNAPASGNFFNSVAGYFTAFNTNLDASTAAARGSLWTGADSLQGGDVPLANSLGLSYNVYTPGSNSPVRIGIESVTRNSGVAGTLVSEQFGPELKFIVHDVTLTAYADPLYDFAAQPTKNAKGKSVAADRFGVEIGLRLQKQLTDHTFAGTGIGARLPKNEQVFQVFAGFTF
jgi:hypothetical protein